MNRRQGIVWLLVLGLQSLFCAAISNEDCSGHGRRENDTCICDNPWPQNSSDEPGWIGDQCQLPTFVGFTSGENFANSRTLEENDWACYAVPLDEKEQWNYLSIFLNRTAGAGDPDIYAYCSGGDASSQPQVNATAYPPTGFTFQDVSSSVKPSIKRTESKRSFPEGTFSKGCYFCVHNYGPGNIDSYTFAAYVSACPSTFSAHDGKPMVCHTPLDAAESEKRYSECSSEGQCVCKAPYQSPVPVTELLPGLGFRDCSAEVVYVPDSSSGPSEDPFTDEGAVEPQNWRFYAFNIAEEDFEIRVSVTEQTGRVSLFAKAGTPPGSGPEQFDMRAAWNPAAGPRQHEIVLAGDRTGTWFVGVFAASPENGAEFEFVLERNSCPGNCSGQGSCDVTTYTCSCNEGYGGEDCSEYFHQLEFNQTLINTNSSRAEYSYFSMPEATDAMLNGNVEMKLSAEVRSDTWNVHLAARPELLLMMDGAGSFPSAKNYTHRMVMDLSKPQTLTLCASQLVKGPWKAALHNPLSASSSLNYTLTVAKIGKCLNNCSGNGVCSDDGVCECTEGWAGGDCSVDISGGGGGGAGPKHPHHHHFFASLFFALIWAILGAVCALAYASRRGVPAWFPLQSNSYGGLGIYQELTENEGI